jgi:DNA adenine methylase
MAMEHSFTLDPPYLQDTRISGRYSHEMAQGDHSELVERLLQLKGMVILSGSQHPSYQPLEASGWRRRSYNVAAYSSDTRTKKSRTTLALANRARSGTQQLRS